MAKYLKISLTIQFKSFDNQKLRNTIFATLKGSAIRLKHFKWYA